MSSGAKSASFDGFPPITWEGHVESWAKQQQLDFDTREPLFWSDGRPKEQLQVIIQTDRKDDPDDDGKRALYLKYKSGAAVRDAVKAAGVRMLEKGGYLKLTYSHDGVKAPGSRGKPPKEYSATYTPVTRAEDPWAADGGDGGVVPATSSTTAPPASGDPEKVAILEAQGIDTTGLGEKQIEILYKAVRLND